jgi:Iron-dependent Transcriptional regulator
MALKRKMSEMLTAKGKYGLKALAHLASLGPGETTQAVEISKANNIPKKFLDTILGELRMRGWYIAGRAPAAAICWRVPQAISNSGRSFAP